MYKATRELIKNRQKYTPYEVAQVFNVERRGGGELNDCFENAYNNLDRSKGIKITSGWLVGKFDKNTGATEIIQHYWNVNADGTYFDTTPGIEADVEYVVDTDILSWAQENYDFVDSCVCSSLLYRDEQYTAVTQINGRLKYTKLRDFSNESLFANNMLSDEFQKLAA